MPMQPHIMNGLNSGIDMNMEAGFAKGWSSGTDIAADMGMDFNQPQQAAMQVPMPFPSDGPSGEIANANNLGGQGEVYSNGPPAPDLHSQQAQEVFMQKAAPSQAMQQRQMKLQAQHQRYCEAANAAQCQSQGSPAQQQGHGNGKRPSHAIKPHVEKPISHLHNRMRHNSYVPGDDAGSPEEISPQIARIRNLEEEMDEDERLLASEEGKKLSSKERRQLRNKASARAFRLKRKEYIGQLEGETALKIQEATDLRNENIRILQENESYRDLLENLFRNPAFTPFTNDTSPEPSAFDISQIQQKAA